MAPKDPKRETKKNEEDVLDDDERELVCRGYQTKTVWTVLYYLGVFFSVGVLWLLCRWKPAWHVYITCVPCTVMLADRVVFKDKYGDWTTEDVFEEELVAQPSEGSRNLEMLVNTTSDDEEGRPLINHMESTNSSDASMEDNETTRFIVHHKLRFILDKDTMKFIPLKALDCGVACASIRRRRVGLSMLEYTKQKVLFGLNSMEVEVKPYWKLVIDEALDPFYMFQLFSLVVWVLEVYYIYAGCILFISAVSIATDVYTVRQHMVNLRDMVAKPSTVKVMRKGEKFLDVSSLELVPGDIVVISSRGLEMPCDAALLSGACVVNESMLTGESVPITKTPLPENPSPHHAADDPANHYSPDKHKRHTLFCGTKVIQTRTFDRDYCLAIVVRTGFTTAKGSLVRSILYPKPVGMQFFRDALRFVGVLAILALAGMIYSAFVIHEKWSDRVLKVLDVITIAVPPALPAAMTIGIMTAQRRLKNQQIFCISPQRINVCGKLKLFCFDKTGTLTNDGMDLTAIYPVVDTKFQPGVETCDCLPQRDLLYCMASCHSLNIIDEQLVGDPLDLKMFEATKWVFEEHSSGTRWDPSVMSIVRPAGVQPYDLGCNEEGLPGLQLGIMQQYTFSSELQRMSVMAQRLGGREVHVFTKGAPETVVSLCDPTTVPKDFAQVLVRLTQQGYRVLACAGKTLHAPWHTYRNMARVDAEKDLEFLGLLAMCNTLKPETAPIIELLQSADIRTVMVTGDNIQTAVSVARECGMIRHHQKVVMVTAKIPVPAENSVDGDEPEIEYTVVGEPSDALTASIASAARGQTVPSYQNGNGYSHPSNIAGPGAMSPIRLAISGKSFAVVRQHCPDLLNRLLLRGTVFARMAPEQKTQLVQELQAIGFGVGMCGDGANDCGALKAAHAGISLSEAEASIASPFTSKVANIECVPTLIKEGRAALVTSFSVFRFMALYSIIQFVSILILYTYGSNLGDTQYLYIDLIIILSLAFVMVRTHAAPKLVRRRPPGSLSGVHVLASLMLQIVIQASVQGISYEYLKRQPWFRPYEEGTGDLITSMENYTVFIMSAFQYMWVCIAFSPGKPYRRPMYTNVLFLLTVVVLFLLTTWCLFYIPTSLQNFLQMDRRMYMDRTWFFRIGLFEITLLNATLSILFEFYILPSEPVVAFLRRLRRKKRPKNEYKIIERHIVASPDWPPPLTSEEASLQHPVAILVPATNGKSSNGDAKA